jgi:hypothetical protein
MDNGLDIDKIMSTRHWGICRYELKGLGSEQGL